jgi:hypothetical protein
VINQNPPTLLRKRPRRWLLALCGASCTLVAGCGSGGDPVGGPVPEDLVFAGEVTGHITAGTDVKAATDSNPLLGIETDAKGNYYEPAPTATQCASFHVDGIAADDFVAVIAGQLNTGGYSLDIEISEGESAYTKPGTVLTPGNRNQGGSVNLYRVGSEQKWQQVIGPNGQEPATITMDASRKSGTVDAWLAPAGYSQLNTPSTIHVIGSWRCG